MQFGPDRGGRLTSPAPPPPPRPPPAPVAELARADDPEATGADLGVADQGRPRISSQPSRSISNGFIRTSAAGNGQLALCWSIAFEIASRFFASAPLTVSSLRPCRRPTIDPNVPGPSPTSTWTPSTPRSSCSAGPSCAASRWSSAARGRGPWSPPPATRPASWPGSTRRCRRRSPGGGCRTRSTCTPDFDAYRAMSRRVMEVLREQRRDGRGGRARRGLPRPLRALLPEGDDAADRQRDPRAHRAQLLDRDLREQAAGEDRQRAGQARRAGPSRPRGGAGALRLRVARA